MPKTETTPQSIAAEYGIELTEKGTFRPGHDAKLKSALIQAVIGGGRAGTKARKQLEAIGWGKYVPSEERIAAVKAKAAKAAARAEAKAAKAASAEVVAEADAE